MARKKRNNRSLWIMLALIVAIAAALFLLPSCGGQSKATDDTKVAVGDQAPAFTVEMTDGQQIALQELQGQVVLLNFWATWCPPCRAELKRMQSDVIDRFAGQEFSLLAVSRGESRVDVENFLSKNGYAFCAGLDPQEQIYGLYATNYTPRNFLIGKDGRIVKSTVGYTPQEFSELVEAIAAELQK